MIIDASEQIEESQQLLSFKTKMPPLESGKSNFNEPPHQANVHVPIESLPSLFF